MLISNRRLSCWKNASTLDLHLIALAECCFKDLVFRLEFQESTSGGDGNQGGTSDELFKYIIAEFFVQFFFSSLIIF